MKDSSEQPLAAGNTGVCSNKNREAGLVGSISIQPQQFSVMTFTETVLSRVNDSRPGSKQGRQAPVLCWSRTQGESWSQKGARREPEASGSFSQGRDDKKGPGSHRKARTRNLTGKTQSERGGCCVHRPEKRQDESKLEKLMTIYLQ